ncbi:N-acyl homoserine lactonase family protein [Aminobacter aminovorans]|uniref:N-acyl homoserine lactonase family protein n=1 Tax=Aminobacter aminovorans TaxID=83263 RepID=UPI002860A3B3|nr:N-acyl homoserine lactonase family protein [Aminobacter aminovorans]MDR7219837.1 glyoxylase-like metal-dependent hydrolase (beta-lactamase superfamily II) [Aminobacter aminovorans]
MKTGKYLLAAMLALPAFGVAQAADTELWRLDCGSIKIGDLSAFSDTLRYQGETRTLTDSCYLIRHDASYMLWDTGLPAALFGASQDGGGVKPSLATTIKDQLDKIGVAPEKIETVGVSHNHFDHVGQATDFPQARLLIGKADLDGFRAEPPAFAVDPSLVKPWLDGKAVLEAVEVDKDVFGDGSIVMLSTPGHTHGSYSLLVRLAGKGPVLLSGDTVHFEEQFANNGVPPFNVDRAQSLASMDRLQDMAKALDATLVVQHDANDIAKLPAFPASAK